MNEIKAKWNEGVFIWESTVKQTRYILFNDLLLRAHAIKNKVSCVTMMSILEVAELPAEEIQKRGITGEMGHHLVVELTLAPIKGEPNKVMVWCDPEATSRQWLTTLNAVREEHLSATIGTLMNKKLKPQQ